MNNEPSIFNLIDIFRQSKKVMPRLISDTHCEQKHHHDFYCDRETQKSI